MTFDHKVPNKLKRTQIWFGSIIGRPIDEDSRMNPISPSGHPMEIEACDYIRPSPTLRPAQRIQIYNQQYWWRLLSSLHESFPVTTRLFGYHDFNRMIAIPYLVKYCPHSWSLNDLGDRLEQWVEEEYEAEDKSLVMDAVNLDWAFNKTFWAAHKEPILMSNLPVEGDPTSLLGEKIYLQPHVQLFEFDYDLFTFRNEFLKQEPEYWIDHDFPKLKKDKKYFMILFRTSVNDLQWLEAMPAEYALLKLFQEGCTIDDACQWMEDQEDAFYQEAAQNLPGWFQKWIIHRLLTLKD